MTTVYHVEVFWVCCPGLRRWRFILRRASLVSSKILAPQSIVRRQAGRVSAVVSQLFKGIWHFVKFLFRAYILDLDLLVFLIPESAARRKFALVVGCFPFWQRALPNAVGHARMVSIPGMLARLSTSSVVTLSYHLISNMQRKINDAFV